MSSIPEEIYHEILLRLPVKSLLKCKCVCENWYALISTSDFIKLHLRFITTQKNNPILMLEGAYSDKVLKSIGYDSLESSVCEIEDAAIEMDYPFKSNNYGVRLVGSCNGLFWIRVVDSDGKRDFLCLWNPATREYKELPDSPIKVNSICAFGYDHKNDDYKLAVGVTQETTDTTLVQVYSLASNSWKPGQTVPYRFPNYMFMQRRGVLINGDLHWLAVAQDKFFLLSLNFSDETFKELQLLPKELLEKNKNPCMILGLLEGCLCILVNSYANGIRIHCEVWKMLDYGVRESWTRRYIITRESIIVNHILSLSPLWSFGNG
ncbi:F-box protein CPR1-like isoform X2 [Papaver somniferum]|uniref:F-box protein CPR1-like isoform X2 n=1 Tax=Papaver somniferum TaxID=3469 RepID=UPI000E703AB9|nr:F-box protein CPR1-like isoform X2 [Papaver somniferum]